MTEFLNSILDSSTVPVLTAFILGLLTAISPCPLFTNITAVGYISKNIGDRRKVFLQGVIYTLGRTFAYSLLGAVIIFIIRSGEDAFGVQQLVSEWGEKILGPALIIIGLFMLFAHKLHLPKFGFKGDADGDKFKGLFGAFLLGVLFAMAFCPTSALFYFGMLITMSVNAVGGYLLPVVFAVATSLPVLIVAWIIAFSMKNLSRFTGGVQKFQKWFNILIAILLLGIGMYYTVIIFF